SAEISDLSLDISSAMSRIDASPERLAALESRISLVETLRHKYGKTIPDVLEFRAKAASRLRALEGRGEELAAIDGKIADALARVENAGAALGKARTAAAAKLAAAVEAELADLGLGKCGFSVALKPCEPRESGCDEIEMLFAPNPGEPARPLRLVASSGEISRVMLALKTVLAAHDKVPILVFDEIDANVGGETARVVGRKLAALGRSRQILCITHLPQVASCASTHFSVRKTVAADGRTRTAIIPLSGEGRIDEIARMLGGEGLTSVVRRHAEELLVLESAP
ncbi:MAG: DNA repair protein RecN, partial [Kiritimatiellae bacterium]|nr:DNA repair protein RecN [Kiritimatiellia bacterium]